MIPSNRYKRDFHFRIYFEKDSNKNGRIWVNNEDHFNCGKVKSQIKKLKNLSL